jgi:hypothetical protein
MDLLKSKWILAFWIFTLGINLAAWIKTGPGWLSVSGTLSAAFFIGAYFAAAVMESLSSDDRVLRNIYHGDDQTRVG